jgi:tryptophan 2,3-dioxygenase
MTKPKPGSGDTDYEQYIRTHELLSLQKGEDELHNDDELFFQVVHQAMELWIKVGVYELKKIGRYIDEDAFHRAGHHLDRSSMILDHCTASFEIMLTMPQADYHEIRAGLGRGSGRDSPGFNAVKDNSREMLWPHFAGALERHGKSILDVMKAPHAEDTSGLYRCASALLRFDRTFQTLRYVHAQMARTEIGFAVKSLKGIPAERMKDNVFTPFFPELWNTVEELTDFTKASYG